MIVNPSFMSNLEKARFSIVLGMFVLFDGYCQLLGQARGA